MEFKDEKETADIVRRFEAATFSRSEWRHAHHLVVALDYVNRYDLDTAIDRIRTGLFNLLDAFGVDRSKEDPYHETLTVFWMRAVSEFNAAKNGASLIDKVNELLTTYDKDYPLKFYTRGYLFSDEARKRFVMSDLRP